MKKIWHFTVDNQCDFYNWLEFSIQLFGLNIQRDFICIIIFGFAFTWEK